jgi:hypothetical protein
MQKQEALAVISNHLNLLTDYDVLEATIADTLFEYIKEIVMGIDEPIYDSRVEAVQAMMEAWKTMKTTDSNDDFNIDDYGL